MKISRTFQSSRITLFFTKEEAARFPGPYLISVRASLDAVDVKIEAHGGVEGWTGSDSGIIVRVKDSSKLKPFGAMEVEPVPTAAGFTIKLPETRRMPRIVRQPKKLETTPAPPPAPALRDLVRWINTHKEQMGDEMVLEVKNGLLRVLISYGDDR